MKTKIINIILLILFIFNNINYLFAEEKSKVLEIYHYFNNDYFKSNNIIVNGKDKDIISGSKKLVYLEGENNDGSTNFPISTSGNGVLSINGNIGIFSPGNGIYAPYVPLEYQLNIPVGEAVMENGVFSNITNYDVDSIENITIKMPSQVTRNASNVDINIYGLDSYGNNLLGFDIFNSNKIKSLFNSNIKNLDKNSYYNNINTGDDGFFVTDKKVLLSKTNYTNNDTDGDGYIGNGILNIKNGFLFNDYDGDSIFNGNINNNTITSNYYNGKILTSSGTKDILSENNDDNKGKYFDMYKNYTSDNNIFYNVDNISGLNAKNLLTEIKDFLINSNDLFTSGDEKIIEEINSGSGGLKGTNLFKDSNINYLEVILDNSNNFVSINKLENLNNVSENYIFPSNILLDSKNNKLKVIAGSKVNNLDNKKFSLNINENIYFYSINNGIKTLYIPYLEINDDSLKILIKDNPNKLNIDNFSLILNKNIIFKLPLYLQDFYEKISVNFDLNISSKELFKSIEKGYITNEKTDNSGDTIYIETKDGKYIKYKKSFSDGGKYIYTLPTDNGTETKYITYNPNVLPITLHWVSNDFTINSNGNVLNGGSILTLDFKNNKVDSNGKLKRYTLNTLLRATPISKVYFKKIKGTNKVVLYKNIIIQFKINGDLSLGSNENTSLFIGSIVGGVGIHTNPYIINPLNNAFLSLSTRKNSIGYPIHSYQGNNPKKSIFSLLFQKKGGTILRFNEVDGDNKNIDDSSIPRANSYEVILRDYNTSPKKTYMNLKISDSNDLTNRFKVDPSNVSIKTPVCIDNSYELYINDKKFYERLYSDFDSNYFNYYINKIDNDFDSNSGSTSTGSEIEKVSLLYLINNGGYLRENKNIGPLTNYFNYPKPICINKSWFNEGISINNLDSDISSNIVALFLKYYVYGLSKEDLEYLSNLTINSKKVINTGIFNDLIGIKNDDNFKESFVSKGYFYNKNKNIIDGIISPISIDSYNTFQEPFSLEVNIYDIFFNQYILNSFQKLFITDKLIPEQTKLQGLIGSKTFTNSNNIYKLDDNFILSKLFKFGYKLNNEEKYSEPGNEFVLDFLNNKSIDNSIYGNKRFFPLIGSYLKITNQEPEYGINYCFDKNNKNKTSKYYYLDALCYDGNTGKVARDESFKIIIPKYNNFDITYESSIYNYTKIGRISSDGSYIPLTSGTTYYAGYKNENENSNIDIFTNYTCDSSTDSISTQISTCGRNVGGNIYGFLRFGNKDHNLGLFSNDNINNLNELNNIKKSDNSIIKLGSINLNSSCSIASYPYFYLNKNNDKTDKDFIKIINNDNVEKNIIKIPFFIIKNKESIINTTGSGIDCNFLKENKYYLKNLSKENIFYNDSLLEYATSTLPLENLFEKRNGEYGIYVKTGIEDGDNIKYSIDPVSGTLINLKGIENGNESKILELEYTGDFANVYNGIQINITQENINGFCYDNSLKKYLNNTDNTKFKELFESYNNCLLEYNNNYTSKKISPILNEEINSSEEIVETDDNCINNPELDSCKGNTVSNIKTLSSDQFIFGQVNNYNLLNNENSKLLSIGNNKYIGNALKYVDSNNTFKYLPEFSTSGNKIKKSKGVLARKNIEIEKFSHKNLGNINDFIYNNGSVEDKLQNSMNYNSLYNDDSIIITNGKQFVNTDGLSIIGGYIDHNGKVDMNFGAIKEYWSYSDNDNLKEHTSDPNGTNLIYGLDASQERRNRIRDEVGKGNHAYISLGVLPKDEFNVINGVIRIAKDSTKYFSNLVIQLPTNNSSDSQTLLLNDKGVFETPYSFNNLTIVYGNKYYTWGNNDTNCNGINPNEVYNRIDKYSNVSLSRNDTMTICLVNKGNKDGLKSNNNTLLNDLEIRLPIKPSRKVGVLKDYSGNETSYLGFLNMMNGSYSNKYGYNHYGTLISNREGLSNFKQRYYVGGITNRSNNYIYNASNYSSYSSNNVFNLNINHYIYNSGNCGCFKKRGCIPRYKLTGNVRQGDIIFSNNYLNNDLYIKNIPQFFLNGFTIKGKNNLGENYIKIKSSLKYSQSYIPNINKINKNLSSSKCRSSNFSSYLNNNAYGNDFINTFSLSKDTKLMNIDIGNYEIKYNQIPSYKISDYAKGITFSNKILDTYKRVGNLKTQKIGNFTNDTDNYIISSLKEQNNKVSIGDIITYQIDIDASNLDNNNLSIQDFYISQVLDRGLELIPDSLHLVGTNLGKPIDIKPIYNNSEEFKKILYDDTNSEFYTIINGNKKLNKLNDSLGNTINLQNVNKDEIVVTKGVVFLKIKSLKKDDGTIISDTGTLVGNKLSSNVNIKYIRPGEKIFKDDINGIYLNSSETDSLYKGVSNLKIGDIIELQAGSNLYRSNTTNDKSDKTIVELEILNYNKITNGLLSYDLEKSYYKKTLSSPNTFGVDLISNGLTNQYITPKYIQNSYYYKPINGKCISNPDLITTNSGGIVNVPGIGDFCSAYNKYMDYVYKGYLQLSSPYNRLIGPDSSNPFIYGGLDGILDIYKIINGEKINNLLRDTDRNTDRDKLLLVKVGLISKGDKIRLTFDAKVNNYNDLNHKLFDYDIIKGPGYSDENTDLVRNDNILTGKKYTSEEAKNILGIYTHAKNTKLFFIDHIGKENIIYDKELSLENGSSLNSIQTVFNSNLSIVNLSGRRNYYICDPQYSSVGNCKKITSLDIFDKEDNLGDSGYLTFENWKRYPESNIPLYKGQKILVRLLLDNNYFKLNENKNNVNQLTINLGYNSNYVISDDLVYLGTGKFGDNLGALKYGLSKKVNKNNTLNNSLLNSLKNRQNLNNLKTDIVKDISLDYEQVSYTLNNDEIKELNENGRIALDFLFTIKHTYNNKNLENDALNSFNKKLLSSFISNYTFSQKNDTETKFSNTDNLNSLKNNGGYLNYNINSNINNNSNGNINYSYYSIQFDNNYTFDGKNITDFDPNNGRLKIKYFVDDNNIKTNSNDTNGKTGLAIDFINTGDSNSDTEKELKDIKITLPYGFSLNYIKGYRMVEKDLFNTEIKEEDINNSSGLKTFNTLNKTVLEINPNNLKLKSGQKYSLYVYLNFNSSNVDQISTFTVEGNLGDIHLFGDVQTSEKSSYFDDIIKTLPTFAENNIFYGNKYIKNNINNSDYVNNNSGNSKYYIIGENGLPIVYNSKNVEETIYIDKGNKPKLIIDINKILDENKNTYSVIKMNNGLISPNSLNNYSLQNNTVYYYDGDINIGDTKLDSNIDFGLDIFENTNKVGNNGGVTIIANGKIFINTNIVINGKNNTNIKNINNIGFIGLKGVVFHPKVTKVEGYFYSPISNNTVIGQNNKNYHEGVITTGYSNSSLKLKGSLYGGTIINERNQLGGINDTNSVENYEFNNLLYLNPPPIFRK